jgi:hypothetical protein
VRLTCIGPVAALRHERVELGFVFGDAQAVEELTEFPLLFFETAQRLSAVFVEGAVAAGWRIIPGATAYAGPHPVHLALHAIHFVLPVALVSASHSSAPNSESEDGQPNGPPDHEAKDDQRDPGGFSK